MTEALTVRPFNKTLHDRSAFSCGEKSMDVWLKQCAAELVQKDKLRMWCATNADGIFVGFYAISIHTIIGPARHLIPAVYVAALAVDKKFQSQQIGRVLFIDAARRAVAVSDLVGSMSICLDVMQGEHCSRQRSFYEVAGFECFSKEGPQRMMIPVKRARKLLALHEQFHAKPAPAH
jgi:GNAT superfamily N-acetyltransferase